MAKLVNPETGATVDEVTLPGEPSKAPNVGKLGDPVFSVPAAIKAYVSGKADATGVKRGPIKATMGLVTFTVMTPGGLHKVNAVIQGTRMADLIEPGGAKKQQIAYEVRFGAVGFDADQMEPEDQKLHAEWCNSLIRDFRLWRAEQKITVPILEPGSGGSNVFTD